MGRLDRRLFFTSTSGLQYVTRTKSILEHMIFFYPETLGPLLGALEPMNTNSYYCCL